MNAPVTQPTGHVSAATNAAATHAIASQQAPALPEDAAPAVEVVPAYEPLMPCQTTRSVRTMFRQFIGGHMVKTVSITIRTYPADEFGPRIVFRTTTTTTKRTVSERVEPTDTDFDHDGAQGKESNKRKRSGASVDPESSRMEPPRKKFKASTARTRVVQGRLGMTKDGKVIINDWDEDEDLADGSSPLRAIHVD